MGVAPVLMALLQEHLPLAPLLGCCLPGVEARVERQGRLLPSLAADQGSGWTCIILPSGVLQQFSSSPFSAASLSAAFAAGHRYALESSQTAL